jgi:hypothetical protein
MIAFNSCEVIEYAVRTLSQQPFVPKSPAARGDDGKVNLCLAAAVAQAGLALSGWRSEADQLPETLVRTNSKDLLRSFFIKLGWSSSDCNERLEFNDNASDATRKAQVLAYLCSEPHS